MEEASREAVVKAFLDYLVDPLLPMVVSGKDPLIENQEAVAKQMQAVVLLYNYYHRLQNPHLEFIEFETFCKLAVTLKPTLIAHMKYMQQSDLSRSDDKENHLSITEKAIKEACKIALALTALKDVSHIEKWPVSKISVLLIDTKKEKCLLLFDTITNGVWSIIEKSLNHDVLSHEHTIKRKPKAGKELTAEPVDGELTYERIAISAAKEATGFKQSEIRVLEKHVTYSLSEENKAAYFYIVQSTQSSNEDNQLAIETVLESLQGPLVKWTSNDWILTQKIEYYDVLPYAEIMSNWASRECLSVCSQTPNFTRFGGTEKDSVTKAVEIKKANSISEKPGDLEQIRTDTSNRKEVDNQEKSDKCTLQKPSDMDIQMNKGRTSGNCSSEKPSDLVQIGEDTSNRKEVDDQEKSDKCTLQKPSDMDIQVSKGRTSGNCSSTNNTHIEESITVEKSYMDEDVGENPEKNCPELSSNGEITRVDSYNRSEEEADSKGKADNNALEKHSDGDIQDSVHGDCTDVESCGKGSAGQESSNKEEVDTEEKPDKCAPEMPGDVEPIRADSFHGNSNDVDNCEMLDESTPEKPINVESNDNLADIYDSCRGPNSCSEEPTGAGNFNEKKKFDVKEKNDECCDIGNLNSISFNNADTGVLKRIPAEELETDLNSSSKRQKSSVYDSDIPCISREGDNRNGNVPMRVYHHQKRKLSVESSPGSSAAVTRCYMETSEAIKSFRNEFVDGKVTSSCIQGHLSSHQNDMPAENTALVPYVPNANDGEKLQTLLATKETEISETALRVLLKKREEMCYQQRKLEDEIASCSRDIQKIIDGDEDVLALKLDAMINCCNDICLKGKNQAGMINQSDTGRKNQSSMRSRHSDSILYNVQSSCQELDDICLKNDWRLPVYLISSLKGGFIAKVTIKEMDLDLSFESVLLSTPHGARDSAAALLLTKLRAT